MNGDGDAGDDHLMMRMGRIMVDEEKRRIRNSLRLLPEALHDVPRNRVAKKKKPVLCCAWREHGPEERVELLGGEEGNGVGDAQDVPRDAHSRQQQPTQRCDVEELLWPRVEACKAEEERRWVFAR